MTDQPLRVEYIDPDPKKLRASWKAAKAKHAAAIQAKGIKFKLELGPLLDKRAAEFAIFERMRLAAIRETNRVQMGGKAKAPLTEAQKKAMRSTYKTAFKPLRITTVAVKEAAESYQEKIAGLGDPAEDDLGALLSAIVMLMTQQIKWIDDSLVKITR